MEKIKGDWTKFLIDEKGICFKRYEPEIEPKEFLPIIYDYFKNDYPEKEEMDPDSVDEGSTCDRLIKNCHESVYGFKVSNIKGEIENMD